jgi:apolipoprotein N-acyltransferase
LTASDNRGRILAQEATAGRPEALLAVDVPSGSGETFYRRFGDLFAWLVLAALATGVALLRSGHSET